MKRELLTGKELDELSAELTNWDVSADGLERSYDFGNFVKAFAFMAGAALHCERLKHHTEWSNVYGYVHVRLVTHDQSGVTNLDATLARLMEELSSA